MICPYRVNVEMHYKHEILDGKKVLVQTGQEETYPECYEGDCPFYQYGGFCTREENEQ